MDSGPDRFTIMVTVLSPTPSRKRHMAFQLNVDTGHQAEGGLDWEKSYQGCLGSVHERPDPCNAPSLHTACAGGIVFGDELRPASARLVS